jgi:hypothetical protein
MSDPSTLWTDDNPHLWPYLGHNPPDVTFYDTWAKLAKSSQNRLLDIAGVFQRGLRHAHC